MLNQDTNSPIILVSVVRTFGNSQWYIQTINFQPKTSISTHHGLCTEPAMDSTNHKLPAIIYSPVHLGVQH